VCFCVERSRWKRGVEGSMRPPEALSKWLWQLWLKVQAVMKKLWDGLAAPSNSLSKTFLQRSCNIPTIVLLLNHWLKCSQYVLGTFCSCYGVPLMSPCFTFTLLWKLGQCFEVQLYTPFPSHARFIKYLWSMFNAKGLMKYVLCCSITVLCSSHIFLHLFFYHCVF